jgi:hypothetical protein
MQRLGLLSDVSQSDPNDHNDCRREREIASVLVHPSLGR